MTKKVSVKLTRNFENNLESIESFLEQAGAIQTYDRLLEELSETLIPNLESFPAMGQLFLERPVCSVEMVNALERLNTKLPGAEIREYLVADYLVLYSQIETVMHLLSIKHQSQLSFNFQALWSSKP